MTFKDQVIQAQQELNTKAFVEYSMVAKLVKSYGLENIIRCVGMLPLKHPNPVGYIIKCCSGKGVSKTINTNIFNK